MTQETIGQRLKFVMESLNLKIRTFANALDVNETSIRNYTTKDAKPGADILERIARHYPQVNMSWLITGAGEPFLPAALPSTAPPPDAKKGTPGKASGTECEKELNAANEKNALLASQLTDKERIIEAKEETIALLRTNPNRID